MESNYYDDEFEDFLKQKADQYTMHPSDGAWHAIHQSLHPNRKWYKATGALLLIATLFFISLEIVSTGYQRAATDIVNDSISSSRTVTSTSAKAGDDLKNKKTISIAANTIDMAAPRNRRAENSTGTGSNNTLPVNADAYPLSNTSFTGFQRTPVYLAFNGPMPPVPHSGELNSEIPRTSEEKQMKEHSVNWLQQNAVIKLSPNNRKFYHMQFYVSPGAGYRRLRNDKSNLKTSTAPPASDDIVNINGIVNHQPSFGLETGAAVLFNVSDNFILKAGLQLNYVKYNIKAYRSTRERTAIALNRAGYSNIKDTITSYSSLRSLSGRFPQELQNQYVQLSLPIGAEVKLLGNKRFQINIAGTIQPTYLIYNNAYLLSSDYRNYTKQPDLVRKWNVNAAVETFISYSVGGFRWQLGPQFRYQLLSSYTDRYPVREYLMEYGVKIGVSKTIR